ncbi:MAG TPA: hypothetical protein DCM54_17520 [Gammaproteobacteria bacterium]|nr:hypothetical protein [Gammaproteobacteria bacterium]
MAEVSIVVMGVAGCGKTTIGKSLAEALSYPFYDGDDFHPEPNVEKMSRGESLTDTDRAGWLSSLRDLMATNESNGTPIVVACSALKASYRKALSTGEGPLFVFLDISHETADARLKARTEHFMPASLVQSQFDTLERPSEAILVDSNKPLEEVQETAVAAVRKAMVQELPTPVYVNAVLSFIVAILTTIALIAAPSLISWWALGGYAFTLFSTLLFFGRKFAYWYVIFLLAIVTIIGCSLTTIILFRSQTNDGLMAIVPITIISIVMYGRLRTRSVRNWLED